MTFEQYAKNEVVAGDYVYNPFQVRMLIVDAMKAAYNQAIEDAVSTTDFHSKKFMVAQQIRVWIKQLKKP